MILQILAAAIAGRGGPRVNLSGGSLSDGPGGTFVQLDIRSDGTVFRVTDGGIGTGQLSDWIIPNSAASEANYEVRFTLISGDAPAAGSTLDTWHDLSTSRAVEYSGASSSGTIRAEIRLGAQTLASGDYTITH